MKFFVFSKKSLLAIVLAIVCLISSLCIMGSSGAYAVYNGKTTRKLPIYSVCTDEKKVALTFDAAWGADKTQAILDTLCEYDVKATFFVVEFWAEKYPEQLAALHDSGRVEIGTHSATHPHLNGLSDSQINLELTSSCDAIKKITGVAPTIFRPPFGEYNNKVLDCAEKLGLATVQWTIDTLDWKGVSSEKMANKVLNKADNGAIVLMHNDGEHTLQALPAMIDGLKNKGYQLVTVSELIYREDYIIDSTGKQIHK